jgi:hypothetical protein
VLTPDSPLNTVLGEPRSRRLIKELLEFFERVGHQRCISLEFPEERIQSRPAVQAIAIEDTGRATALQHIPVEPSGPRDESTGRLLAAVAALHQDPTLGLRGFYVDISVSLGFGKSHLDMKLLAHGLRGWCARQIAGAPAGPSSHVITVSGTPVRLLMEKTACLEGPGRLSIFRAELPDTFATAVSDGLRARLHTLIQTSADRHVLLFESQGGLWSAGHLRTELDASFEHPDLHRVHEIWMVEGQSLNLGETRVFRRIMAANASL